MDLDTLRWQYDAAGRELTQTFNQLQMTETALSNHFTRMGEAGKLNHDALLIHIDMLSTQRAAANAYIDGLTADLLTAKLQVVALTDKFEHCDKARVLLATSSEADRALIHRLRSDLQAEAAKVLTMAAEIKSERQKNHILQASVTHLESKLSEGKSDHA
jgi:hypothetical protein